MLPFFFFNDTATTEIYTLSLHDALPISSGSDRHAARRVSRRGPGRLRGASADRKSTRLNSSHDQISYAVFCLKKKNNHRSPLTRIGGLHVLLYLLQRRLQLPCHSSRRSL